MNKKILTIGILFLLAVGGAFYFTAQKQQTLGASITNITATSTLKDSRSVINNNFTALNNNKLEHSDMSGSTGITYATGTISFDCSEVEGSGINCSGESVTLDNTGNWSGTFDSQEGSYYLDAGNLTDLTDIAGDSLSWGGSNLSVDDDFVKNTGDTLNGTLNVTGTTTLVTTSGNVGIGTTSPNYKLDVNGKIASGDMSLSGATYKTINDWVNTTQSAGQISGGTFTDEGDGDVTIAAGTGFIKTSNSAIAETKTFDWSEQTNLTMTDGQTNYIYVEYNAGNPQIGSETSKSANSRDKFYLGKVFREGTSTHIINAGINVTESMKRTQSRVNSTDGELERASGMILSETGTRNIKVTAGAFFAGFTRHTTTEVDTSGADTFEYYRLINGSWTETDESQIDNTQYNDVSSPGSESLATLSNNKYGVHWVYVDIDGHILVVYGQEEYDKESDAQDATPPSISYGHIADMSFLAGKIIIEKNASSFADLSSAFYNQFIPSVVTDHGNLAGLMDDDHSIYPLLSGRDGDTLSIDQVNAYDAAGLKLYDDGGNGIFVEDGGNVGIGTTSPSAKLQVNGTVRADAYYGGPDSFSVAYTSPAVATGTAPTLQKTFDKAVTLTKIECNVDTGTSTIQFDERSSATPNTTGTDVLSSALTCDDTSTNNSTSFNNASITSGDPIKLDINTISGSPTLLRIHTLYDID